MGGPAFYACSTNYLIDVQAGINGSTPSAGVRKLSGFRAPGAPTIQSSARTIATPSVPIQATNAAP
jgi:hypothetical protein